jgi:rubrerythrin
MEFKSVKVLDGGEEKGVAQVEEELLKKHEEEVNGVIKLDLSSSNKTEPVKEILEPVLEETKVAAEEEDLDEQKVLSYIGKRYNKQINSFDDLVAERQEAEPLPEDVAAYMKYKKETGRGFEDFLKLKKDYDTVDSDTLLKEYLSSTQQGLDEDDIETLMDDYRYDEDIDDESTVKKTKIAKKKIVAEAKKFFNEQKEKYKVPLESSSGFVSEAEKEEYESYKQYIQQAKTVQEENERKRSWFDQKTNDVFSNEFKGFEFKINDKSFSFSPGDASELKKIQSNPSSFIGKFLDENGLMKDATGYHKSLAIAMHPDKFAKYFYEQGMADATDDVMRKTKNINMSERRAPEVTKSGEGMQVRAVNPDSGRSLKIRSIKRI